MKKLIILPLISVAFLLIGYLSALPSVEGGNVPPPSTITGKTIYNGRTITDYTHKPVSFWVIDEKTGQTPPISPQYNTTNGTYSIADVPPGEYGISVVIDDAEHGWDYRFRITPK